MASWVYNKGLEILFVGGGGNIHAMLLQSSYAPNRDHQFVNSVITAEVNVAGYSRKPLVNPNVQTDYTGDRSYFDADDLLFTGLASGQTIGYVVLFQSTGVDATSPLLSMHGVTPTPTGGDFAVTWKTPAEGAIILATSPQT